MNKELLIAPSILASDWSRFGEEVNNAISAGADWVHIDVMDGHFVPPITFGPGVVSAIRTATKAPLDVHLMIEQPENHIKAFADAGADLITVHQEACPHLHRVIQQITEHNVKAGVALNPATPVESIKDILCDIDLLLIMTVNPGWGGQKYIQSTTEKIKQAAQMIEASGRDIYLEVDGGINEETAPLAIAAGANVLVAGSYVYSQEDYKNAISKLRDASNP